MIKPFTIVFLLTCISLYTHSQTTYFPPISGNNWEAISPSTLDWCDDRIEDLYDYLELNHTKAFIVLSDGKVVLEKYFGTFTQDSVWYWASAGKSLTSFMVGIAQQENLLSINDATTSYLGQGWTDCDPVQESKITIRHQLTMTTGFDDGVPENYCTLDTCLICLADPGTRWAYHNAPYTLLDQVIESATGVTLNNYINQKLKLKTGITGAFLPSGYNNVFWSKARSMARYGLLILNHGNWNGNQIMTDTAYFNQMVHTSQSLNLSYGYLWWLNGKASFRVPGFQFNFSGPLMPHAPDDMISALGKNGQLINVVPSRNLVVIRMGEVPGSGEVSITFNDTIWQKINLLPCSLNAIDETPEIPFTIRPNPAQNEITFSIPGQRFELTIYNHVGQPIWMRKNNPDTVNISCTSLAKGIYFARITSGNKIITRKFLIQ